MSKRIFDKTSYSQKTLDTFEILAAYFVDIYYNHLYIEAKTLRTNKVEESITDGYKHALNAFIQGIENPKLYKKTLTGIHNYFTASGFQIMNFYECIDRLTKEFIPQDYYETVSKQQKIAILKLIICQSNKVFLEKVVRKFIKIIIDNHKDADNIRVLQDEMIDIFILERESMYHKFVEKNSNKSNINTKIIESMQHEIKTLLTEKFELKKLVTNLKKIILKNNQEIREEKKYIEALLNNNSELTHELNELKMHLDLKPLASVTSKEPHQKKPLQQEKTEQQEQSSYFIERDESIEQKSDVVNDGSGSDNDEKSDISNITSKSKYYKESPLKNIDIDF